MHIAVMDTWECSGPFNAHKLINAGFFLALEDHRWPFRNGPSARVWILPQQPGYKQKILFDYPNTSSEYGQIIRPDAIPNYMSGSSGRMTFIIEYAPNVVLKNEGCNYQFED